MEFPENPPKTLAVSITNRHRCAACFRQYKKKEHLVEHMQASFHSAHQPQCGVCQKHCNSFESLREHATGAPAKGNCSKFYAERGCKLCMRVFDSSSILSEHQKICFQPAPARLGIMPCTESLIYDPPDTIENGNFSHIEAIAMECVLVGGGSDGTLDLCARVCLIDEDEKVIFHTYVIPQLAVTNYRYEITGITEDHLRDAMPLNEVREKILQILYNGESIGILRLRGGKARVLLAHGIHHDLDCLKMYYPDHLLRDTAKYPPLMKTNLVSHSLRYLVKTYLGYAIQTGMHDPYEDCVSVMRLYKRLRSQKHTWKGKEFSLVGRGSMKIYDWWNSKELEKMTPDELFDNSISNYRCWCLDP